MIHKDESGNPGKPVANEDDAIMAFTSIEKAKEVANQFEEELTIYKGGVYLEAEVIES